MRFEDVFGRFQGCRRSCADAADLLGVSMSTIFRYRCRYETDGAAGPYDRRLGRASARRAPVDEVAGMPELFETRYRDFIMGASGYVQRRLDDAQTSLGRTVEWVPAFPPARLFLACPYAEMDRVDDARHQIRSLLSAARRHILHEVRRIYPFEGPRPDRFLDGLRKADLPE